MKSPQELLKEGSVSIRNEVKKAYLVTGKLKISPLSATLTPFHTVSRRCLLGNPASEVPLLLTRKGPVLFPEWGEP
jgi:hypothetical protein